MMMPPGVFSSFFGFDALHQNSVMQRSEMRHASVPLT
jgi:hypothetical protein